MKHVFFPKNLDLLLIERLAASAVDDFQPKDVLAAETRDGTFQSEPVCLR